MDSYNVRITKRALEQLDDYVAYVQFTLLNPIAADHVSLDAEKTVVELAKVAGSLKLCEHPTLRELGYRSIKFEKHDYVMLYRMEGKTVFVDGAYHSMQDYESTFADTL